jgi:hypothetical protein
MTKNDSSAVPSQKTESPATKTITIKKANIRQLALCIVGTSPYVQNRFAQKALDQIIATQKAGSQSQKGKKREPKDFDACYEGAKHVSTEHWYGIPAPAFRAACVSACRLIGFKMTLAKLSIFALPDGFDKNDSTPLVKITKGEPERHVGPARNDNGGIDIRVRPMWQPGWESTLRVEYDGDIYGEEDIVNLVERVGRQVGIGEGRNDSRNSCGCGWGSFTLKRAL